MLVLVSEVVCLFFCTRVFESLYFYSPYIKWCKYLRVSVCVRTVTYCKAYFLFNVNWNWTQSEMYGKWDRNIWVRVYIWLIVSLPFQKLYIAFTFPPFLSAPLYSLSPYMCFEFKMDPWEASPMLDAEKCINFIHRKKWHT